jgi:putative ABC transport system permease protein
MNTLRQIAAVTGLNLRNLHSRLGPSLVIVAGMAAAIGVLIAILSLAAGYAELQRRTGDPERAIILPQTADTEGAGAISRGVLGDITTMPGIARDKDGASLADPEYVSILLANRRPAGRAPGLATLRGMGRKGLALRPELKIVAGRMFRPGARELIVGTALQPEFRGFDVGDKVIMQDGQWPIVGSFTTGGDVLEGQIIGDTAVLMSAARRNAFNSVIVRLDGPNGLKALERALAARPRLAVRAERQSEYYERTSQDTASFFRAVAYAVGGIMALGALFGALNTMYSAVGARTQEIATLRALGFGGMAVAVSVIAESVLLAVTGALIGIGLAWALFNGQGYAFGEVLFHLAVSPALVAVGLAWALAVALLGGILPAIRAARLPVVDALRAT